MLVRFQSWLEASHVSRHIAELWYNKTVFLWMTIYMLLFSEPLSRVMAGKIDCSYKEVSLFFFMKYPYKLLVLKASKQTEYLQCICILRYKHAILRNYLKKYPCSLENLKVLKNKYDTHGNHCRWSKFNWLKKDNFLVISKSIYHHHQNKTKSRLCDFIK